MFAEKYCHHYKPWNLIVPVIESIMIILIQKKVTIKKLSS